MKYKITLFNPFLELIFKDDSKKFMGYILEKSKLSIQNEISSIPPEGPNKRRPNHSDYETIRALLNCRCPNFFETIFIFGMV